MSLVDLVAGRNGFAIDWLPLDWSCERYEKSGTFMPDDGLEMLAGCDSILLGAVGDPRVPDHLSLWGLLLPIRRGMRQFVNVRPVASIPGIAGPLRSTAAIDILIIRENAEGEYTDVGGSVYPGTGDEIVVQSAVFTRRGTERVLRYAFEQARLRRGDVVSATKSNGLFHSMPFWDRVSSEVAAEYPDVNYRKIHVDALAAKFVLSPTDLDVVVGSNLFGDILSDLGAALMGGIGLAASANINAEGNKPSMFEPVHGSAPDIVGQGIANPTGQILSAALMLETLGEAAAGRELRRGLLRTLARPDTRTRDVAGTANTAEALCAIAREIEMPIAE
jgi:tartrate dehydrogenase/decarboxylase / D-malate dehydrogenase